MICENCGMLTKPFRDGTCEFCGLSVIKKAPAPTGSNEEEAE